MANDKPEAQETSTAVERPRFDWPSLLSWPESIMNMTDRSMRLEEFNEGSTHVVRAEMPGVDPDKDVEISVDHGMLTVRAERRQQKKSDEKGRYRCEFSYGAFSRTVRLPAGASEDDVKATYRDGILEIRFPVDGDREAARTIPVTRD